MEKKIDKLLLKIENIEKILNKKPSLFENLLKICEKLLVPIMLGLLVFFVNYGANKIAQSQLEMSLGEVDRKHAEFDRELNVKYVEMFYRDIKSDNPNDKKIALELIKVMQPDLAKKMGKFVESIPNVTKEMRKKVKNITDEKEQEIIDEAKLHIRWAVKEDSNRDRKYYRYIKSMSKYEAVLQAQSHNQKARTYIMLFGEKRTTDYINSLED